MEIERKYLVSGIPDNIDSYPCRFIEQAYVAFDVKEDQVKEALDAVKLFHMRGINAEALACGDRVVMSDLPGIREWLDTYAPGADIRYVELPRMNRVDEAVREELPAYEKRIAESLQESVEEKCTRPADVSRISWGKIAEKVLV